MSRLGGRAMVAIAAVVALAACLDFGGPKTGVVSISNLQIPYPVVVLGDSLRDSTGAAVPLQLTAFDPEGRVLPTEPVAYFVLDSTIKVDTNGYVRGLFLDTLGGRVVAGAGTLQTQPQRILVSVKPETVVNSTIGATDIIFDSAITDSTKASNRSAALALTLKGSGTTTAQGFIVTYELTHMPAAQPDAQPAGVPTAYIGDEGSRLSLRDTTDRLGIASRRAILRIAAVDFAVQAGTKADSIVVRATVKYLGVNVPGSPIDYIIPLKKKP